MHELTGGETVRIVGLAADSEIRSRTTQIADIEPLELPLSRTMRFRDSNIEVAQLVNPPTDYDGVLLDKDDRVLGLWSSFAYENGREDAQDNKRRLHRSGERDARARARGSPAALAGSLNSRVQPIASARDFGLSEEWAMKLARARRIAPPGARHRAHGGRLAGAQGAAAGRSACSRSMAQLVTRFREVERAVGDKKQVAVTVWRGHSEQTINVDTVELPGADIDRIVQWAGATLQAPHRAMSAQRGIPPVGVYVGVFFLRLARDALWTFPGPPHC